MMEENIKFQQIRKRDGRLAPFDADKITEAVFKAAAAVDDQDRAMAKEVTDRVLGEMKEKYDGNIFSVEDVQDMVEKVLIEKGYAKIAKAYILYRDKRNRVRIAKSDLMAAVEQILLGNQP